jgi:hypothetical protein
MLRKVLLIFIVCPLFLEFGTRLHHYWGTGLINPLKDGLIFYSEPAKEAFILASKVSEAGGQILDCEILVSGGSLVYGYGQTPINMSQKLSLGLGKMVCIEAAPGRTLKTELEILSQRTKLPDTVLFVSGFNDILDIKLYEDLRQRRMKVLQPNSLMGQSLFLNKLYRVLMEREVCRDLDYDEIKSQISQLTTAHPNTKFLFILQPVDTKKFRQSACVAKRKSQLEGALKGVEYVSFWDQIPKEYFFDACHLYPEGIDRLILEIAKRLGQAN